MEYGMIKECPVCGSRHGHCPECGKVFEHGTVDHCDNPACIAVNAPIDCDCGFVVSHSDDGWGVLDFDMRLIPFTGRAA